MNKENQTSDANIIRATTGACNFVQAKAAEGQPEKLPSVEMEVYSGGKISVNSWGAIVADLKGMTAKQKTPILYRHDSYSIDSILGQTKSVKITDKITASGQIMGKSETVASVVELSKNGYEFQISMGVEPLIYKIIQEDESMEVNGQTLEGPFTLITKSKLKEVSILPLGADETTSAAISAAHNNKEADMPKETKEVLAAAQIKAEAIKEEKSRVKAIMAATRDYPEIGIKAQEEGWGITETKSAVLAAKVETLEAEKAEAEKELKAAKADSDRPGGFNIQNPDVLAKAQNIDTIIAAACVNGGMRNVDKQFSADVLNKSGDIKARGLSEIVCATLALEGKSLDVSHRDPAKFLEAAFSTADIGNVLSGVANKFVTQGFGTIKDSWREVSSVRSVNDFKANTGVRLVMSNLLKNLAPSGEIEHASLSDKTRTIQAGTKALLLGITRQDIINDDLGLLYNLSAKLGNTAARTFNIDFWGALEDAVSANFTDAIGNKSYGALDVTAMKAAMELFMSLQDDDGNPVGIEATKLLCGSTSYAAAMELYKGTAMVGGTAKSSNANIFANKFEPVFSPFLSAKPWWLVGDPVGMPLMEAAFLYGNESPVVETADADFNTLGIKMRCYYDYGVAFAENKAAVYSTGAAK